MMKQTQKPLLLFVDRDVMTTEKCTPSMAMTGNPAAATLNVKAPTCGVHPRTSKDIQQYRLILPDMTHEPYTHVLGESQNV